MEQEQRTFNLAASIYVELIGNKTPAPAADKAVVAIKAAKIFMQAWEEDARKHKENKHGEKY